MSVPHDAPVGAPTITNAGSKARHPRKLFVNVPVSDLQRSIRFFETLGFTFNPQFTDATATCMIVGEDAYFMLLAKDRFASFTTREVANPRTHASALFSFNVESREAVDATVEKAIAAGGARAHDPEDHGFMYESAFYDPDGFGWGVFWMDPAFVPKD